LIWGPGTAISSGFFFGGFVWPRREVRVVHVDNYYYRHHHAQRQIERPGLWRHDDSRRREFRESRRRDDQRAPRMTRTPEERREIQAVPAPRNPRTVDRNNRDRGDGVRGDRDRGDGVRGDGVRGAPQAPREARDDQGPRVRRPQGGDERAAPRARNDGSGLDRQREERRIERGTPQRGQTRPEQFHRENRGD
jgi:hypothetical protein